MGRMGCDRRWGVALLGQRAGWRWWRCVSGAGVVALLGQRLPIGLIGPIIPIGPIAAPHRCACVYGGYFVTLGL